MELGLLYRFGTYRVGPIRVCKSGTVAIAICRAGNIRTGRQALCNGLPFILKRKKINEILVKTYMYILKNKLYSLRV